MLDDAAWESVKWEGEFIQRDPYENEAPSQKTAFKVIYDNNNIYVAIRAFDDNADEIERRLTRRDQFQGDFVGISFDIVLVSRLCLPFSSLISNKSKFIVLNSHG